MRMMSLSVIRYLLFRKGQYVTLFSLLSRRLGRHAGQEALFVCQYWALIADGGNSSPCHRLVPSCINLPQCREDY